MITIKEEPYKTTLLLGKIDVGNIGIRVIGIVWLIAAIACIIVAIGSWTNATWWLSTVLYVAIFSLVLCIFGLPGAKIGILANVLIIAFYIANRKYGWL